MTEEKFERAIEIKKEIAELERQRMAVQDFLPNGYDPKIHFSYRNEDHQLADFSFIMFDDIEKVKTLVTVEIDFIDSKIRELKKQFREL